MVFEEKIYLYLLAIIPVATVLFIFVCYWKNKKQKEFGNKAILKVIAPDYSLPKIILKFCVVLLALVFIILALVNPKIGTKIETIKREGVDIVFAVDVSRSMLAEDVAPSRLEKSKQIISQIVNQLAGDRIGIVAYAGSAYPVLPITTDYGVAKMFLQALSPDMVSSQGTSLNEALTISSNFFETNNTTSKVIILISDGEDHEENIEEALEIIKEKKAKLITIGVGTTEGSPIPIKVNGVVKEFKRDKNEEIVITKLNPVTLEQIAKETKGGYVYGASTKEVLEYIKKALENIEKTEFETTQFADYQSQYQWFLAIGFLLLFLDIFFLERKTKWLQKLDLFSENKK